MSTSRLANQPSSALAFIKPLGLYDPSPNAYSHVAVANMPSRLIYIAGQGGETEDGLLSNNFEEQVGKALRNLEIALHAANGNLQDVAKLTLLIVDHSREKLAVVSTLLQQTWGEHSLPACTLIPVPRLALDGMLFEIDATAVANS